MDALLQFLRHRMSRRHHRQLFAQNPCASLCLLRLLPALVQQLILSHLFLSTSSGHGKGSESVEESSAMADDDNDDGEQDESPSSSLLTRLLAQSFLSLLTPVDTTAPSDVQARRAQEIEHGIQVCRDLHLFGVAGVLRLDSLFQQSLQDALCCCGPPSFGQRLSITNTDKYPPPTVDQLDEYARELWEHILHFMVGSRHDPSQSRPALSSGVLKLLILSGLIHSNTLLITNKGFQFLLQDIHSQVWHLLLQYASMASEFELDCVEALQFFFQLSCLELGESYALDPLTPMQRRLVADLRDLGIIYQRKKTSKRFFPTRLATALLQGHGSMASVLEKSRDMHLLSRVPGQAAQDETGFLIVETNYRVYAYTQSPLQISILALFVQLKYRFPNLAVGIMTRDSVRKALANGITASQMTHYLISHAHPQMRSRTPILPPNIIDQISLWDLEGNRLKFTSAVIYRDFTATEFQVAVQYAKDLKCLLWESATKRLLCIREEAHEVMKSFIRQMLVERP